MSERALSGGRIRRAMAIGVLTISCGGGGDTPTAPSTPAAAPTTPTANQPPEPLGQPSGIKIAERGRDFLVWIWDPVEGATGYEVHVFPDGTPPSERGQTAVTEQPTWRVDGLEPGAVMGIFVRALRETAGARAVGPWSDYRTSLVDPAITGPHITSIFLGGPTDHNVGYLVGETIRIDIRWDGRLEVKGYPFLILQIGTNERSARMEWVQNRTDYADIRFRYRIKSEDQDIDGISIPHDAIQLPEGSAILDASTGEPADIDLREHAVENDPTQKVHSLENAGGHRLRIGNLWITSSPSDYDTGYIDGNFIRVDIRWDGQIRVDGIPYMNLEIGEHVRPATMVHHTKTDIQFRYIVQRDDHDPDGISFDEDAIQLVNGASIFSPATGQPAELSLAEWAVGDDDELWPKVGDD